MCRALLAEIDEVLTRRPRLRRWIDVEAARRYVDTISTLVDLVPDPADPRAVTRDVKDDYLVCWPAQRGGRHRHW